MKRVLKIEIVILLLLAACALGNVRRVPSDYPTIQAAIDDCNDGDTVLVAPGTYTGDGNRDIEFEGKAITVKSEDGPQTCIINCQGTPEEHHHGFGFGGRFYKKEDANSIVQGFTIINGYVHSGGGILCDDASPLIIECIIKDNTAISTGGGIYCNYSNSMILDCLIHNNTASSGGGIGCRYSYPTLLRCFISNNTAESGGGITISYGYGGDSPPTLKNCLITGNNAEIHGGGISSRSYLEILNCTLSGNRAGNEGGGIYFFISGGKQINNSILYGNTASTGSEIAIITPLPGAGGCGGKSFKITNSIVGSDPNAIYFTYCDGYLYGEWLYTDPLFAQPGYWDSNGTPDDTNDDFWVDGDYHLKSRAGRWDPNSGSWAIDEVTSPCIDAGDPNTPISDEPFPNGGIVNMGAYGGSSQASKSYFGEPLCETIIAGDINGDCKVDLKDFMLLAAHWLEDGN